MRALRLDTIETTARPEEQLRGTLIAAEPRFRPCAEFLPDAPLTDPPDARMGLTLWEEGAVRSVRELNEVPGPMERSQRCLVEVLQAIDFPDDPMMSDDRRLEVSFRPHWTAARLDLVAISDEQKARTNVADPTVEGIVDLVSIKARIDSIAPRLGRCMRSARKRNPELGHQLTVRLRLAKDLENPTAADALVEGLSVVESELGDEDAEVCIIRELERLAWPKPVTRTARVEWPFLFAE